MYRGFWLRCSLQSKRLEVNENESQAAHRKGLLMPKLWEIVNELVLVKNEVESKEGELDSAELEERYDRVQGDLSWKVSQIGRLLHHLNAQSKEAHEWYTKFKKAHDVIENAIERTEKYLVNQMERGEVNKIEDPEGLGTWSVELTKGETVPVDFSKIPDDFIKIYRDV